MQDRRNFLKTAGKAAALSPLAGLAGCVQTPYVDPDLEARLDYILERQYNKQPFTGQRVTMADGSAIPSNNIQFTDGFEIGEYDIMTEIPDYFTFGPDRHVGFDFYVNDIVFKIEYRHPDDDPQSYFRGEGVAFGIVSNTEWIVDGNIADSAFEFTGLWANEGYKVPFIPEVNNFLRAAVSVMEEQYRDGVTETSYEALRTAERELRPLLPVL